MKEDIKLLVEQARSGSETAFNKLYNLYNKTVWYTAYNIVKNNDVADDIVSSVFTKVYLKLETFTQHISFEMWLKTITVNTAIDYVRKSKKEKLNDYIDDDTSSLQLGGLDNSPEENMIMQQNIDHVLECIPKWKKRYRDLIYLKLDGKSYKEIAQILALPENTVKTGLNKARNRLKILFSEIS